MIFCILCFSGAVQTVSRGICFSNAKHLMHEKLFDEYLMHLMHLLRILEICFWLNFENEDNA